VAFRPGISAESTVLYDELGLKGSFLVQYSGNMGLWHDMQSIIRAAYHLRDSPKIVFLLIGEGRERKAAEDLARELRLTNIRWLPYQPKEALEDSLSCCHVALISQRAGLEGVAVPCKLYGILASGRAVVAQVPAASEVSLVVQEEACGVVVAPGDHEALAREILALSEDPDRVAEMGRRAHAAYKAKYTLEAGVKAFEEGLRQWG
jgi:glycosyltransferase involved in cell wall biosynthesis